MSSNMKLVALAQSGFDINNFKVLQQYELRMAGPLWDLYQTAIFTA